MKEAKKFTLYPSLLTRRITSLIQGFEPNILRKVKQVTLKLSEDATTRSDATLLEFFIFDENSENFILFAAPVKDSLEQENNANLVYISDAIAAFEAHISSTLRGREGQPDRQLALSRNTLLIPLIQCCNYNVLGMPMPVSRENSVVVEVLIDRNSPITKKISVYDSQKPAFFDGSYVDVLEGIAKDYGYEYVPSKDYHYGSIQKNNEQPDLNVYDFIKNRLKNWKSELSIDFTPKVIVSLLKNFVLDLKSITSANSIDFFKISNTQLASVLSFINEFVINYSNCSKAENLFIKDLQGLFRMLDGVFNQAKNSSFASVYEKFKDKLSSQYPEVFWEEIDRDTLSSEETEDFTCIDIVDVSLLETSKAFKP